MRKISVIIPAINEEKYILTALKSLKSQTYKNFEIIVKDGGSTDRTAEIAKKYVDKVISCKDISIGQARNQGADHASGDILIFMDADSILPPNTIEKIKDRFEKFNFSLLIPRYVPKEEIFENNGKIIRLPTPSNVLWSKIENFVLNRLLHYAGGMCMACDATSFKKIGGFKEKLKTCEDLDISHRFKKVGDVIYDKDIETYFSARRYAKWGWFKTSANYFINSMRSLLGLNQPKHVMIR